MVDGDVTGPREVSPDIHHAATHGNCSYGLIESSAKRRPALPIPSSDVIRRVPSGSQEVTSYIQVVAANRHSIDCSNILVEYATPDRGPISTIPPGYSIGIYSPRLVKVAPYIQIGPEHRKRVDR